MQAELELTYSLHLFSKFYVICHLSPHRRRPRHHTRRPGLCYREDFVVGQK